MGPRVALTKPWWAQGVHNDLILGTKNHIKSIKSRLWNRYGHCIDFFIKIGRLLLSKCMTFCRSSRARSRFEAYLISLCNLVGIYPKISPKLLPKPFRICSRSDPEPYQKIDDFLEGSPGALATNNATPLHQIWSGKGEGLPKTPSSF